MMLFKNIVCSFMLVGLLSTTCANAGKVIITNEDLDDVSTSNLKYTLVFNRLDSQAAAKHFLNRAVDSDSLKSMDELRDINFSIFFVQFIRDLPNIGERREFDLPEGYYLKPVLHTEIKPVLHTEIKPIFQSGKAGLAISYGDNEENLYVAPDSVLKLKLQTMTHYATRGQMGHFTFEMQ